MKTTLVHLFIFILLSVSAQGQQLEDHYLQGKWTASCPVEILSRVKLRHCQLCSFVSNGGVGEVKGILLDFKSDSLTIQNGGQVFTTPYKRDKDNHSFQFNLGEKEYLFRVFYYDDKRIIEDSDGLLIVSTKSE